MKIRPLHDRIVDKRTAEDATSAGGIVIPDAAAEKPSKGEVYIGGESMTDRPPFKRPTNLVFQNLSLFPHMNVFKNIGTF